MIPSYDTFYFLFIFLCFKIIVEHFYPVLACAIRIKMEIEGKIQNRENTWNENACNEDI